MSCGACLAVLSETCSSLRFPPAPNTGQGRDSRERTLKRLSAGHYAKREFYQARVLGLISTPVAEGGDRSGKRAFANVSSGLPETQ